MPELEYLDPEIANEGFSADRMPPNAPAWMEGSDPSAEEYQPDIEPPHIPDYAALKKHKHYKQYFRPYRYQPFPAFVYHATQEPKIVKNKEEFEALGPGWSPKPIKPRVDMTGKSLPVKSETQRLAEVVAQAMGKHQQAGPIDPTSIAAVVAAVLAATGSQKPAEAPAKPPELTPEALMPAEEVDPSTGIRQYLANPPAEEDRTAVDDDTERKALLELAERDGIKIDNRWGNKRLKEALGLTTA